MTKIFPFQQEDVERIREEFNGRCLIASEMGLGKTLQALLYIHEEKIHPVVIVCQAHLKLHWEREAKVHFNMRAEVLSGMKPPKKALAHKPRLIIINYDILRGWRKELQKLCPQLIVIDECQALASRSTIRTKEMQRLCKRVPKIIALSGTPLTNRPADLWPTLNIIRPDKFKSWPVFARKFCDPRRERWGWTFKGAVNIPLLHRRLKRLLMIRRRKVDVLPELPPKQRFIVPLEISDKKQYEYAEKDFLNWLQDYNPHKAAKAARAEQLVKIGYLKRLVGKLKTKSVKKWIDDFLEESDGKLILYVQHNIPLRRYHRRYRKRSVMVNGSVPSRLRQQLVDKFSLNDKTRLFIANLDAASTGWNGTAANDVAFAELSWTPGKHMQGEDRPCRIGQKGAVNIWYLIAQDTIEEDWCSILQEKQEAIIGVLDGDAGERLDLMDLLIEKMKDRAKKKGK